MDIAQASVFLEMLQKRGMVFGLERVSKFLALLGNPHLGFKSVHIAGTNGKGSTAAMLEAIFRKAGYKTGLYTSPHLVKVNERFRVNGREIGDKAFLKLVADLKGEMEKFGLELTYFEFLTALCFKHFADLGVEVAVVEVGMGGRLDATNVLKPVLTLITNVEKEHEKFLGKSLKEIALEKAGIVKKGIPLVTREEKRKVLQVLGEKCRAVGAELIVVQGFYPGRLSLLGSFQKKNAALAVEAVKQLGKRGFATGPAAEGGAGKGFVIGKSAVEKGLASAQWLGRFQVVQKRPAVVLDCAHNPAGARALAKAFAESFPGRKALLVFGVSSDKKVGEMAKALAPLVFKVFATGAKTRPLSPERVAAEFGGLGKEAKAFSSVGKAVKKAVEEAGRQGIVLVCGSCFVVGEALEFF